MHDIWLEVHDLIARFFQAFDEKAWTALRGCLCDEVFADYSSFRKTPPATLSADLFVEQRRASLHALEMLHGFSNLRVEVVADGATAAARCNYVIHRFSRDHGFHSCGHYLFALTRVDGGWRLARITQKLLRNWGNPELHGMAH